MEIAAVAPGLVLLSATVWVGGTLLPRPMVGATTMLPAMILCTLLAGGYTIIRARRSAFSFWRGWAGRVATAAVLLAANVAFVAHDLLVSAVFGLYALWRTGQLITWAVKASKPLFSRPLHLQKAIPWRLAMGGGLNAVAVALCMGASASFFDWWPNPEQVQHEITRLVTYHLAVHNRAQLPELQQSLRSDSEDLPGWPFEPVHNPRPGIFQFKDATFAIGGDLYAAHFLLRPDRQSFILRAWPTQMPAFPFNYLITLPSFYADHTGAIRAVKVNQKGVRCPAEAPIRARVHGSPVDRQSLERQMGSRY